MRRARSYCLAAGMAVLGLGLGGPAVSACDGWCSSRYSPAYYGPPVYTQPGIVYAGPPVYVYSYFSPAYAAHAAPYAYGPTYFESYYPAYYRSPPAYRTPCGRQLRPVRVYRAHGPCRATRPPRRW